MAKVNSRKKGSKNERNITKVLEQWTGYEFSRVPSSGGLRWGRKDDTVGDVICSDEKHSRYFRFTIEAKNHKDINFEHLLLPVKNSDIQKFWEQAKNDGDRAKKIPLLFMRYNGMKKDLHFVACTSKAFDEIFGQDTFDKIMKIRVNDRGLDLVIIMSDELIKTNYKLVHKRARSFLKNNG